MLSAPLDHAGSGLRPNQKCATRCPNRFKLARVRATLVFVIISALVPILWSTETGSEAVLRIAVQTIGGMVTSSVPTPVVIPASFAVVKGHGKRHWETVG